MRSARTKITYRSSRMMGVSRQQVLIFVVLWFSYASTYLLRKPLGIIKMNLEKDLQLTKSQLGWMDMALLMPYASVQMFFGSVGDQLGARVTLSTCMILAGVFMLFFSAVAHNYMMMMVLLSINGAAQSLCWPATSKAINAWFPPESRNSVFGVFGSSAAVGGIVGTSLAIYVQTNYSWTQVHTLPAIIIIALGCVAFFTVRMPSQSIASDTLAAPPPPSAKSTEPFGIRDMIRIPQLVMVTIAIFCLKLVRYCIYMWIPLYLLHELNYTPVQAGLFSTLFEVGGVIGSILIGVAIDKFFKGKGILGCSVAIAASGGCLVLFMITQRMGMLINGILLLFAGLYNCGPDNLLGGSIPAEIAERESPGTASAAIGFVNGFGNVGAMIEGPVVGYISDIYGYQGMFFLIIGLCIFGAATSFHGAAIEARRALGYMSLPTHSK